MNGYICKCENENKLFRSSDTNYTQVRWFPNLYAEKIFILRYWEGEMQNGNFVMLKKNHFFKYEFYSLYKLKLYGIKTAG